MKRILLLLVLCLNISMVLGQEYKNWEKYDIEGFYIIAKSKAEAKISKNVLREGADYYILTEMDDQVFPSGGKLPILGYPLLDGRQQAPV